MAASMLWRGATGLAFLLPGPAWAPPASFGLLAPLLGSLAVASLALAAGGGGGYLAATALACDGIRLRRPLLALFAAGSWLPTVVLGLFGVAWLQPRLGGYGILPAGLVLAVAIFWPAVAGFAAALERLPADVFQGAVALGSSPRTARRRLAPVHARPFLVATACGLFGRLLGEGTVTALLIGNNGLFPPALLHPSATLASVLLTEGGGAPPGSPWDGALWSLAAVLAILSALTGWGVRRWAR